MKNIERIVLILFSVSVLTSSCKEKEEIKKDQIITLLMEKMSIEDKIAQLNLVTPTSKTGPFATKNVYEKLKDGSAGNIYSVMGSPKSVHRKYTYVDSTSHKIPFMFGLDIIHGYKTVFPIPLALSCSWDTSLIRKTARVAAVEATSYGYNWTFSPMVDLTRDPRWGRVMEGSGEDPYLGSLIAAAMVKGYQGDDLTSPTSLMACVKHFGMYGASEAGRDYNTTDMSRLNMYQNYLPPYKAAIEAGAGSIMTSFNDIDGVPATVNKWLLTDLLRKEWGFDGFVVTDYNCIQELLPHGVAADIQEAAIKSLKAGVDMDMASESMAATLTKSLEEGKISERDIDIACRRVLDAKYKLGLFDDPYRGYDPERPKIDILSDENKAIAKEAALKSMVLLKNENDILPLKKDCKIALIGPHVTDQFEMFSMWSFMGDGSSVTSIYEGIKKQNPNIEVAKGTQVTDDKMILNRQNGFFDIEKQEELEKEAIEKANKADVIVAVLGESRNMSGEAKSMTNISLPDCQRKLLRKLKATGKPVVLLLTHGRPLTIQEDLPYADAIFASWRLGTEAGNAIADILFGNYNPSGKLTMTFPRNVGQIPIYYNHKNTGRPFTEPDQNDKKKRRGGLKFQSYYLDQVNTPLFPFGYGLSYTSFEYGEIKLSDTLLVGKKQTLLAKITITNTGKYAGEETVQLYINDPVAEVTRPVKELKQFQKVFLQPEESKELTFNISTEDLKFYNSELKWDWESGDFNVYVGTNSEEVKAASFTWNKRN
ncbi:beta-glucosidase BglX [Plebeiibacterium marinum]|uniref:Periplasmic beta-glucosidase n=1 Tax=Plebeiibacterium marinum TaxID=2992111 RepID=A0AAE3MFJ0_9BACT|nr:beta-glucosidase BglX [Plebeiobacterium marinum]MCW3807048.1 beta-glucosidase BglX [Plebeiobacterium marinum]